jgi:hypothetical protein
MSQIRGKAWRSIAEQPKIAESFDCESASMKRFPRASVAFFGTRWSFWNLPSSKGPASRDDLRLYRSRTFFLIVLVLPHGSESSIAIRRNRVSFARWNASVKEAVSVVTVPLSLVKNGPAVAVALKLTGLASTLSRALKKTLAFRSP